METAVLAKRTQQVLAVGGYSWEGRALAKRRGLEHHLGLAEDSGLGIPRTAHDIILYSLVVLDELLHTALYGILALDFGNAIVETPAVGRPCGEHLKVIRVIRHTGNSLLYRVVHDDVAQGILYLDLVGVSCMEHLTCGIHRVGYHIVLGVERRVYTGRDCGIGLHVDLLHLTVVYKDCSALVLAYVELHVVGLVVLVGMAVDTLSLRLGAYKHIAVDNLLVVVGEVALVDGQLLVCHI